MNEKAVTKTQAAPQKIDNSWMKVNEDTYQKERPKPLTGKIDNSVLAAALTKETNLTGATQQTEKPKPIPGKIDNSGLAALLAKQQAHNGQRPSFS